jgi:hypothetical protein
MSDPPVTEPGTEQELEPVGLVDPRAIHPGPVDAPGEPRPEVAPAAEGTSKPVAASRPDPDSSAVDVDEGPRLSDPRASLPGPEVLP